PVSVPDPFSAPPTGIPLRFPDWFVHWLPQPTSPDAGPRASPRRRRRRLPLVTGCLLVRPLEEPDDGAAAPHAQEVHHDEKDCQGSGDPMVEKKDRFYFAVWGDKNDKHRHDDQEEDQVNPSHGAPPTRETGGKERTPGTRTRSGPLESV